MSLKSFLFPLTIIMVAIIVVWFIKPAVLSTIEHAEQKEVKVAELEALKKTKENMDALSGELESFSQDGTVVRVGKFLPKLMEQDRVVWAVNKIAERSGVVVKDISFSGRKSAPSEGGQAGVVFSETALSSDVPAVPKLPSAEEFSVSVGVDGSYAGVKAFFEGMSSMFRANSIAGFSLDRISAKQPDGTEITSDLISGTIDVDLFFLSADPKSYASGYLLPLFQGTEFDISPLEGISRAVSEDVFEPSGSGRANPFLP